MKKYRQLVKELPSKKVVFAFGRFQPPTTGHELLVNAVKKVAIAQKADHVIFASRTHDKKSNPLPVDRKVYYLNRMFPRTNFVAANEKIRTFIEVATFLSTKYKNLVMIAGSDRVPEYRELLNKYNGKTFNFDTIEVISAGERDPDSDSASGMSGTKMREAAKKGDYASFKKGLPHTMTDLDGKRLMNEIREGMGSEPVKEQVKFETNELREKYFAGEIFHVDEIVESEGIVYKIVKRGSNHLLLQTESGELVSKWPQDIQMSDKEFKQELQEMKFSAADKIKVARIIANALGIANVDKKSSAEQLVNDALRKCKNMAMRPEYVSVLHNMLATAKEADIAYDEKLVPQKVAEQLEEGSFKYHMDKAVAAHEKGDVKKKEYHLNNARTAKFAMKTADYAKNKDLLHKHSQMTKESTIQEDLHRVSVTVTNPNHPMVSKRKETIQKTVKLKASDKDNAVHKAKQYYKDRGYKVHDHNYIGAVNEAVGLKNTEKNNESDQEAEHSSAEEHRKVGSSLAGNTDAHRRMKIKYKLGEALGAEDDMDIQGDIGEGESGFQDKDIDDMIAKMTDDDYLEAYDDEELAIIDDETGEHISDIKEEAIMEVLSRAERIKARIRFAKTETKRARREKIALKTRSSNTVINKRARRLAVNMMKQRLAKKPLNKLSIGEKERIERAIQGNKATINRIAMKLAPRVRKIENDRLTHKTYTK